MARMKKKAKKTISLILILVVILIGFIGYKVIFKGDNKIKDSIDKIIEPENPIKTYTAKLIATGDGLIHSPIYKAAYNNGTYDFSNMLTYTKEKLKDYDIKYYNQETVFDDTISYGSMLDLTLYHLLLITRWIWVMSLLKEVQLGGKAKITF